MGQASTTSLHEGWIWPCVTTAPKGSCSKHLCIQGCTYWHCNEISTLRATLRASFILGHHRALERCSATKNLRQAAIVSCRANTGVYCWRQAIRARLRCWQHFFNTSTSLTQALFSTTAATDRAVTDRASSPCRLKGKSKSVRNNVA